MKWKNFSFEQSASLVLFSIFIAAGYSLAEKSMWQKFKDFFTPGESVDCEGPTCDEYKKVQSQLNKVEGKYSRERRPFFKRQLKGELDSLTQKRDSLVTVLQNSSGSVAESSAQVLPTSSSQLQSQSSSSLVQGSIAMEPQEPVVVRCMPDTFFVYDTVAVHDTVLVHDTLFVVVTNKPEPASDLSKSAASSSSEGK